MCPDLTNAWPQANANTPVWASVVKDSQAERLFFSGSDYLFFWYTPDIPTWDWDSFLCDLVLQHYFLSVFLVERQKLMFLGKSPSSREFPIEPKWENARGTVVSLELKQQKLLVTRFSETCIKNMPVTFWWPKSAVHQLPAILEYPGALKTSSACDVPHIN